MYRAVASKPSLWSVDLREDTVTLLPRCGRVRICLNPARWDHGMIYLPPGAKIVNASTAAEARRKVEELMECVPESLCHEGI